ncbi:FkbM family methyltransferase [Enterobacteriaceae bacterium ESL0689]|nr:FkbM family methyltransferase [Enterobacteriaceae bacterium ESL0689]
MSFISYAQNLEDVVLWKALKNIKNGFYIDVGANDPITDSVTRSFYERGWHGINIEPILEHFNDLNTDRPRDINLNCALNECAGELDIWECDVRGWATLDKKVAQAHEDEGHHGRWHKVKIRTLSDICDEIQPAVIHFLKIDVEGFELSVLKGNNWSKYRPWIIVVESTFPNTKIETFSETDDLLINNNYLFVYADGINRFYVSDEHKELLAALKYPPNIFDDYQTYAEFNALKNADNISKEFDTYKSRMIEDLTQKNSECNKLLSTLEVVQKKERNIDVLISNIDKLLFQLNQKKQHDDILKSISYLTSENKKIHAAYDMLSKEHSASLKQEQKIERDNFIKNISYLSLENERINIAYDALSKSYKEYQQHARNLEHEVYLLKTNIETIYNSTSWRLSFPIRFLGRIKNSKVKVLKSQGLLNYCSRQLIKKINNCPKVRHIIVFITKKTGMYSICRNIYLQLLLNNTQMNITEVEKTSVMKKNIITPVVNSHSQLSVDELYERIKNELNSSEDKRMHL